MTRAPHGEHALRTVEGDGPCALQEGSWPGRPDLRFGWTLCPPGGSGPPATELAFRLSESRARVPACVRQVHGTRCHVVADDERPALLHPPTADGLLTSRRDLLLGISVADCAPLFLSFPGGSGILHAGWRGVVGGILPRAVEEICGRWSVRPDTLELVLGPCIQTCCFEVSPAVGALFAPHLRRPGRNRVHVDLPGALLGQWRRCGGLPGRFLRRDRCTVCGSPRMFSHRRAPGAGRNLAYLYFCDSA